MAREVKPVTWETFYERFYDWADSTQVSNISKLTTFGPSAEVCEIAQSLFDKKAVLPSVFGIHIGWIIVLALVVLMHIYMNYTKQGYEIAVIGDSYNTARYAGMNVGWVMVRTMLVSGAICGIVGFILVSGQNKTITSNVANGVGFTAITVAWLGHLNAFAMIIISMILAILTVGSSYLQQVLGVPSAISEIVSGILLFCMLGCEFFINYQLTFRSKVKKEVKA